MTETVSSLSALSVDRIVREVLTDLAIKAEPVRAEPEQSAVDGVYIGSRVVSLIEINERLGNAKKLFISPKSILTPSAKDEIRKRKIEVAVKISPVADSAGSPGRTLWIGQHKPAGISTNLFNRLQKNYDSVQDLVQKSFETLNELLDEADKQLSNEKMHGIILTKQSATAIRLASRRGTLRPVLALDPKQTAEDVAELNANLIVIHPERVSESKLFELIQRANFIEHTEPRTK